MSKIEKQKYKIGQKLWYIADGYITQRSVAAVVRNQHDEIIYFFWTGDLKRVDSKLWYQLDWDYAKEQSDVYPDRKSLIKSINEIEEYDE